MNLRIYTLAALLLTMAGSTQAISFRDYYYGNATLDIPSHKTEVDEAVAKGELKLMGKNLTDLIDFDETHVPGLSGLRNLMLSRNKLTILSANTFNGLANLQQLWLDSNKIESLPEHIFDNLTGLSGLILDNNRLTTLPDGIFNHQSNLVALWLMNNQLIALPENIFHRLTRLRELWLYGNQLTIIPENIVHGLQGFQDLDISDNPIHSLSPSLVNEVRSQIKAMLKFKTKDQEQAEYQLFNAIRSGSLELVRYRFNRIVTLKVWETSRIDISKIRDANGNNLLHATINALANKIKDISNNQTFANEGKKVVALHIAQKIYTKMFMTLTQFCGPKVQDMLLTRNKNGDDVLGAAIGILGPDSLLVHALRQYEHIPTPAGQHASRFTIKTRAETQSTPIATQITFDQGAIQEREEKTLEIRRQVYNSAYESKESEEKKQREKENEPKAQRLNALKVMGLYSDQDDHEIIAKRFNALSEEYQLQKSSPTSSPAQKAEAQRKHEILMRAWAYLMFGK